MVDLQRTVTGRAAPGTGRVSDGKAEIVRVWLLGGFSVSVGSRTIGETEWRLKKSKSLIKLLSLAPNHRMHRERVMDVLWPKLGREAATNNLQNFPVISSATVSGSQVSISGYLDSHPSSIVKKKKKGKKKKKRRNVFVPQYYIVQFFSSPQLDPSNHGEGKTFLGQTTVVTNLAGEVFFDSTFTPSQPVSPGETVAATATRYSTGDTSEFSEVEVVS